jgi:hypothetical protein
MIPYGWRLAGLPSAPQIHHSFCNLLPMSTSARQIATILSVALAGAGLMGCGSINEKVSGGVSDAIPAWAGGLPADAPPRPGTAKYDEFMRERERRRQMPASERDKEANPAPAAQGQPR